MISMWENSKKVSPPNSTKPKRFPNPLLTMLHSLSTTSKNSEMSTQDGIHVRLQMSLGSSGKSSNYPWKDLRPELRDSPEFFLVADSSERSWVLMPKKPRGDGPRCLKKVADTGKDVVTPRLFRKLPWKPKEPWGLPALIRLTTWISWDLKWCER